jgi:hypothetical protein
MGKKVKTIEKKSVGVRCGVGGRAQRSATVGGTDKGAAVRRRGGESVPPPQDRSLALHRVHGVGHFYDAAAYTINYRLMCDCFFALRDFASRKMIRKNP